MSCQPIIKSHIEKWRSEHDDWKELAAFMLSKNTGRRFKKKKKKKDSVTNETNIEGSPDKTESISTPRKIVSTTKEDVKSQKSSIKIDSQSSRKDSSKRQSSKVDEDQDSDNDSVDDDNKCENNITESVSESEESENESDSNSEETNSQLENKGKQKVRLKRKGESIESSDSTDGESQSDEEEHKLSGAMEDERDRTKRTNVNKEKVVKRIKLSELDNDEDIEIGQEEGRTAFLFESASPVECVKKAKDAFFMNSDDESEEGEEEEDNVEDKMSVDQSDDSDNQGNLYSPFGVNIFMVFIFPCFNHF